MSELMLLWLWMPMLMPKPNYSNTFSIESAKSTKYIVVTSITKVAATLSQGVNERVNENTSRCLRGNQEREIERKEEYGKNETQ